MYIPEISAHIDARGMNEQIDKLIKASSNFEVPLARFQLYIDRETIRMFRENAKGGSYRAYWPYFKDPIRVRKTDGAEIHRYGGTPRLRAGTSARTKTGKYRTGVHSDLASRSLRGSKSTGKEPNVRAVLRPSGQRARADDAVLIDTSRLLHVVASQHDIDIHNPYGITWGTSLPYAIKQHKMRPILFFTESDPLVLERYILKHFGLAGGK